MSNYVRPTRLEDALELLTEPAAAPLAGGTDLAGQIDCGIREPSVLVDIQSLGLDAIRQHDGDVEIGAAATLADIAASDVLRPYECVVTAASQAASPLLRNVGTAAGNLCQRTRCWYYRGREWNCWLGGGETCYAQVGDHRKHGLVKGDCISAHPSDLAPALAACRATVAIRSRERERETPLLELYRTPTADNRSLLALEPGELIVAIRLPGPPDSSVYLRAGERRDFSFPLVSVAGARHGSERRLVAAGIANIPWQLDSTDPLDQLDGHPQSAWKRDVLAALIVRIYESL